jgi:flagellar motor switch protein FliG
MNAATNDVCDAGIRKAAILVAALDQHAADSLLTQLGPERAQLVRQTVMALDDIDHHERQRVIDEFRRIGPMLPGQSPPGIELDNLSASQQTSFGKRNAAESPYGATDAEADDARPFDFLQETEEEKLAHLLGSERPQTIALVLSHLPAQRAGEVLARFDASLQVEVVRRLVDHENANPEVLREIQRSLEARLSQKFAIRREPAAGPGAVTRILAACNDQVAGSILNNLAVHDRTLAEQFGCRPLEFDELMELDDAALAAVVEAAEPEVVQAALLGALPELLERLLRCMDPAEAAGVRYSLDNPGPICLRDIEEARRRMAALAQRFSRNKPQRIAFAA